MKKFIILLGLILIFQINCKKIEETPQLKQNKVISAFFKFSGTYENKKIPSFRLNINVKEDNSFTLNVLTPFNSLVSSMFFDNEKFVLLDLKNKKAYIQNKEPFSLEKVTGLKVDLLSLTKFFNLKYGKNPNKQYSETYDTGKIITNKLGQIIILGNDGFRAVLEPIGKPKIEKNYKFNVKIPENFKVIYVD